MEHVFDPTDEPRALCALRGPGLRYRPFGVWRPRKKRTDEKPAGTKIENVGWGGLREWKQRFCQEIKRRRLRVAHIKRRETAIFCTSAESQNKKSPPPERLSTHFVPLPPPSPFWFFVLFCPLRRRRPSSWPRSRPNDVAVNFFEPLNVQNFVMITVCG